MRGRMRELCAGVNVDLGTAAAFRDQWARETPKSKNSNSKHLVLTTDQAPGDAVAMTAAIYSLHQAYPGKYTTSVESYWPEVFEHSPDVTAGEGSSIAMHYPAIHDSNTRGIHFMQGWCEFLGSALGVSVPLATNRPRLYFSDPAPPVENFWLVCSGGKRDFTNKQWHGYQGVVAKLKRVKFVQVGGSRPPVPWRSTSQEDSHPRLAGAVDMVGKTSLRELFDLVRRCRGVLCGVSLLMHVAAALEKPAVVVAGGREPVQWNAYPKQHYLHTVGTLDCCAGGGCWKARTVALADGSPLDSSLCERPTAAGPECMNRVTVDRVTTLVAALAAE